MRLYFYALIRINDALNKYTSLTSDVVTCTKTPNEFPSWFRECFIVSVAYMVIFVTSEFSWI